MTHSFGVGQRFNQRETDTSFEDENRVRVRRPANANACPPGHCMHFILRPNPDMGGWLAPSVARIIRIG